MAAAVEYIKALASGPEMASRVVGIGYDAQSKLISSAADYYRARAGAKEIIAKANQYNVTTALEADIKNQASELSMIDSKLKALLSEAQVIGQSITAMLNNLHASAGAQGNDTVTTSL